MDANQEMRRGMLWLGSASLISRLIDASSTLALLWFLSREQLGVATLAGTVITLVEAFSGLGVGTALLQKQERSHEELSSLFWYCCLIAVVLTLGMIGTAPWLAQFFRAPQLAPLLIAASTKLAFVGAAVVPQQLINRSLGFRKLGVVTTFATLLAAIVRIGLAAGGWGAWAPVVANTANGIFTLIGVYVAEPFLPALRFDFRAIRPTVTFGAKVASSGVVYQVYRNIDYVLVGRLLGVGPLGIYRVAFEVAMSPAIAVLNVVNRTALPVFARVAEQGGELTKAFLWNLRSLGLLLAPIVTVLALCAPDVLLTISKPEWVVAATGLRILAVAALFRSFAQMFSPVFFATDRPAFALYDSLWSLTVLVALILCFLSLAGPEHGVEAVSAAWLLCYPLVFTFLAMLTRRVIELPLRAVLTALKDPALCILSCGLALVPVLWLSPHIALPRVRFTLEIASAVVAYLAYLRLALGMRPGEIMKKSNS